MKNQSDIYTRLAAFLKALGNPSRLTILHTLLEKSQCPHGSHPCSCGETCDGENCKCGCKCGELVDIFPMAQSTVSQHLKELKKAGLIESSGRKNDYTVNHQNLKELLTALLQLTGYDSNLKHVTCCCECCGDT